MRCLRRQLPDRSHFALIQRVMEGKKSIGIFFDRLFFIFGAIVFLIFIPFYLTRELWFDEVLTLQFAFLPNAVEIYKSYTIPNNQIIHTIALSTLLDLGIYPETARVFPLICGFSAIYILWRNFKREIGRYQLAVALAALVISPVFMLYATALRGYMLAALFTVSALCCGKKYALGGRARMLVLWFVFSPLAVGVMPAALAGIAASGLYIAPYCGKNFWKNKKLYLLAISPFAGFLLFYLPIADKLVKAFDLKEGWHHAGFALLAVATGVAVTFFVPLISGAFFHRPKLRNWTRTLIWFIPLAGVFMPVAPFPRVYFVLFPVFALLCGTYLRRAGAVSLKVIAVITMLWGCATLPECSRKLLSPAVSSAGQDDFFAPRFACRVFSPHLTATAVEKYGRTRVFVSFEADPFAMMYAVGGKAEVIPDIPAGKVTRLADDSLVILAAEESKEAFESRFNGTLEPLEKNALHQIFRLKNNF